MSQPSQQPLRIIIVGGGIAGLAAAIALHSPNRHITVLERSAMLRETGALISLQPNASKIITRWGLDPVLRRVARPQADRAMRVFSGDADGALVREIPLAAEAFGADRMLYHRQDLHAALREAAAETGAAIRTSAEVVRCDPDEGLVELRGGEVLRADVLVGADGIKSTVRAAVLGGGGSSSAGEFQPRPTGISAYRALIPTDRIPLERLPDGALRLADPAATTMVVGRDRRVIMGPGRGGSLLGVVALVPDGEVRGGEGGDDGDGETWQRRGTRGELLAAYAGFAPWVREVLGAADDVGVWQLRDVDALPTWTRGRAVLVGDAAHAMLPTQGQGASQAVEDVEALQAFLPELDVVAGPDRAPGSPVSRDLERVERVLRKVFAARYERASLIQAYSRQQARPVAVGEHAVTLDPGEFMRYNCDYDGAVDWLERQERNASGGARQHGGQGGDKGASDGGLTAATRRDQELPQPVLART